MTKRILSILATVTVTKVTSGYIILAIEGCLNNGLNMISGEFCCQI